MAKRKITLDCPACGAESEVVGDPTSGKWYCFACRRQGTFGIEMTVAETPEPEPEPAAS